LILAIEEPPSTQLPAIKLLVKFDILYEQPKKAEIVRFSHYISMIY